MEPTVITWIWLGVGLALIALEPIIPGLVVSFLGAAAVLVAGARWLGLVESPGASLAIWMVLSVVLVLGVRRLLWKPGDARRESSPEDEDLEALGTRVRVVARCDAETRSGRIRFRGTGWPAQTIDGVVEAGQDARLLQRDNLTWIVEPWQDHTLEARFEAALGTTANTEEIAKKNNHGGRENS